MRLVDNLAEQQLLEQLIETSKPPLPPEAQGLHYLLGTPFRYASPHASRFREPHQPGIWYGAEDPHTVAAELAYWRWKFLVESDGLRDAQVVTEHTFFQARFTGAELDLTLPPWTAVRDLLRHGADYSACHRLARALRERPQPPAALRYESARREGSTCHAVLDPCALSLPALHLQQTWTCKTTRDLVMFLHDEDALEYAFGRDAA
ncbi:RES domain-containing protein [Caenimonas sedimenti]|uniref:RES domain-containing protein n=2 Tax=Caenimonas sedimenti TaxID=2596921 RepID=A0A562ZNN6_9BURK|nr:RES domain-containing protein [Caenimonas sedimenti]